MELVRRMPWGCWLEFIDPGRCKTSSVGQSTGLSIPRSSVRFRQNPKTNNSILHGFEQHRPSSKGTRLLFPVLKAIKKNDDQILLEAWNVATEEFSEGWPSIAVHQIQAHESSPARVTIKRTAESCKRDNVVYWKTKRKIKNDLQCTVLNLAQPNLLTKTSKHSRCPLMPPLKVHHYRAEPRGRDCTYDYKNYSTA